MFIYVTKNLNIIHYTYLKKIKSTRNWNKVSNSLRYEGMLIQNVFINLMVRDSKVKID